MVKSGQKIVEILRSMRWRLYRLRMKQCHDRLAQIKSEQKKNFLNLRNKFSTNYQKLKKYNINEYVMKNWEHRNKKIEDVLLPYPPFSFFNNPIIIDSLFCHGHRKWLKKQLTYLEKKIPKIKLKRLLQEDYVGEPLIVNPTYLTSYMSIQHLYHIIRFLNNTKNKLNQIETVVEWGGGYGNFSKIFKRLKSKPFTYVIYDTPLISCIQWLYLTTIFGEESINLLINSEDKIHAEKINLVPICFLKNQNIDADLFVSTWGLSESSKYSQDYVANQKFFNSKYILLAYQDSSKGFPNAKRVGKLAVDLGAIIENISFLQGNYYAFR